MTVVVPSPAHTVGGDRAGSRVRLAGAVVAGLLGVYAVYELALVFGAPIGRAAWGGTHTTLPVDLRLGSVVAVLLYLVSATIVLRRAGFQVPWISVTVAVRGSWVVATILTLSAVVNALSDSPWERFLNAPVTLALAALSFYVATRRP